MREGGKRYDGLRTALFDARHPLLGVARIWGYVLRPGPSATKLGG